MPQGKSLPFKPYIEKIAPYVPGRPTSEICREFGLTDVLKLASNENPLGPSPKAAEAVKKAIQNMHVYPEGLGHDLVGALSKKTGLEKTQIVFGNGSNEIIELICRGFLNVGDEVISSAMSFLVYPILTQVCGGVFIEVPMKDYTYDLEAIAAAVTDKTKVIFIANPNNPTGTYVGRDEVEQFLKKIPPSVVVCFDEAYYDFVDADDYPDTLSYVQEGMENLVVFRTFSKSYGLAGLRIGYACASPKMAGYLHKIRQPFNVNLLAQKAAEAAIGDDEFLAKSKEVAQAGRQFFYNFCKDKGFQYLQSQGNFVLIRVGGDGEALALAMMKEGVIVRAMASYGLPDWLRVSVGLPEQNRRCAEVLIKCLEKTDPKQS